VLPKEEKKVKGEEVVVRHGGRDRGLPLALQSALQDTVALAKSLHNCLEEQKKKGVKRGAKAFWGGQTWRTEKLAMAEGRYVKGEHMVMVWCTGTRCEGQGNKKSDGQQKRKKGRNDKKEKKRFVRQKIHQKTKMKKVISMVLTGIDPAPLWRQI
jgi:hypothetical protein